MRDIQTNISAMNLTRRIHKVKNVINSEVYLVIMSEEIRFLSHLKKRMQAFILLRMIVSHEGDFTNLIIKVCLLKGYPVLLQ